MDVFSLMATISLNSKGFESALQGAQNGLSSLVKNVAITQAAIKGLEAGFNAMTKLVKSGVDAYANYEQLIGGVDTLFKSSSSKVQEYAKNAYMTAGLSANQYMEQATSFSASLIQGLTKTAEKAQKKATGSSALQADALKKVYSDAADLSDTAIRDMSDNANKMGTDMQALQNAYNGFAKGNFTMLDNLKLGYGGTKTEMVRLINDSGVLDKKIKKIEEADFATMISAIHAIQKEMGITGTTAEEAASTIEGSRKSLYSAFENLLTFATDGEDGKALDEAKDAFVKSFASYFNTNLAPRIIAGMNGSTDVVDAIVKALLTIDSETLTGFVDGALNAGTGLLTGLTNLLPWLFGKVADIFKNPTITEEDAASFGNALGDFVGTFISEGLKNFPTVLTGLVNFGVNVAGGFVSGIISGLTGTGAASIRGQLNSIDKQMGDSLANADENYTKEMALIEKLESIKNVYGEIAINTPEWKKTMEELIAMDASYGDFFNSQTGALVTTTEAMKDYTESLHSMVVEEAKRRALQSKLDLWTDASAQYYQAQSDIELKEKERSIALEKVAGIIQQVDSNFTGEGLTYEQIQHAAYSALNEITGGEGNTGYNDAKIALDGWLSTLQNSDTELNTLKDTLPGLEQNMKNAEIAYLTSADAIDQLTGSASNAAAMLSLLEHPETGFNSGQYYSWYYGKQAKTDGSFATGLDYVPYDGYIAELHKGEAILTSAEASSWRSGSGSDVDFTEIANVVSGAIKSGMSSVGFYFDNEQVAAAVTDKVSQNIADKARAWGYA